MVRHDALSRNPTLPAPCGTMPESHADVPLSRAPGPYYRCNGRKRPVPFSQNGEEVVGDLIGGGVVVPLGKSLSVNSGVGSIPSGLSVLSVAFFLSLLFA